MLCCSAPLAYYPVSVKKKWPKTSIYHQMKTNSNQELFKEHSATFSPVRSLVHSLEDHLFPKWTTFWHAGSEHNKGRGRNRGLQDESNHITYMQVRMGLGKKGVCVCVHVCCYPSLSHQEQLGNWCQLHGQRVVKDAKWDSGDSGGHYESVVISRSPVFMRERWPSR